MFFKNCLINSREKRCQVDCVRKRQLFLLLLSYLWHVTISHTDGGRKSTQPPCPLRASGAGHGSLCNSPGEGCSSCWRSPPFPPYHFLGKTAGKGTFTMCEGRALLPADWADLSCKLTPADPLLELGSQDRHWPMSHRG